MDNATRSKLTIVMQGQASAGLPWIRLLLGDLSGDVVVDPDRRMVPPRSLVVCDRLDLLRSRILGEVRRHGSVGLLHVGDRRYRSRLSAYVAFGFVWRTYYHSALSDLAVRQMPLGPVLCEPGPEPTAAALRPPIERLYAWSYTGGSGAVTTSTLTDLSSLDGGHVQVGDQYDCADPSVPTDTEAVLATLADSVFAVCPGDDVHLESPRIYDALEMGAIPVVERRRRLDYFGELLGDHPLPTVRSWREAPALLGALLADEDRLVALHQRVLTWWTTYKRDLSQTLQADVETCLSGELLHGPVDDVPLNRPAPRWRGRIEHLRHRR